MGKVKKSVCLDKDVFDKIKDISSNEERTFSQQVNKILKDYLADKEK